MILNIYSITTPPKFPRMQECNLTDENYFLVNCGKIMCEGCAGVDCFSLAISRARRIFSNTVFMHFSAMIYSVHSCNIFNIIESSVPYVCFMALCGSLCVCVCKQRNVAAAIFRWPIENGDANEDDERRLI